MTFLKRIVGGSRKKERTAGSKIASLQEMRDDPNLVQVYDEYGREVFITRNEWQKNVLPGALQQHWDEPEVLYGIVVGAVNEGFAANVLEAAHQLKQTHPDALTGATILAVTQLRCGLLDDAEAVLKRALDELGRQGVLLTNLAKVAGERGDASKERQLLWEALEADPNQDNAVQWWAAIHRERDGERGYEEALRKVAALGGSWYPQLWLARAALEKGEAAAALEHYRTALATGNEITAQALMQISGDLGKAGMLEEILSLVGPAYRAEQHGLQVGNNLIKANLALGRVDTAKRLVDELRAFQRPDWAETLNFWDDELDKASGRYGADTSAEPPTLRLLTVDRPIWSLQLEGAEALLPAAHEGATRVAVLMASCARPERVPTHQRPELDGIVSRGVPLLLAESLFFQPGVTASTLVPVLAKNGSFVLMGKPWDTSSIRNVISNEQYDLALSAHLDTASNPWRFTFTLHDLKDTSHEPMSFSTSFDAAQTAGATRALVSEVLGVVARQLGLPPPGEPVFGRADPWRYLSALHHSLAFSIAANENTGGRNLFGERNMLNELLDLALEEPLEPKALLLFIGALAKNKAYGSAIYQEYRPKAERLLSERQLEGKAADIARRALGSLG